MINEDIMQKAREVARKVREDYGLPPNRVTLPTGFGSLTIVNDDLATYTIARAITEERMRWQNDFEDLRLATVREIERVRQEERERCENAVLLAGLEAPIPETLLAAIRNRP